MWGGSAAGSCKGLLQILVNKLLSYKLQENVDEAVEKLKNNGINVLGVVCHVCNAEQRKNMIDQTIQEFGRIDVIISNAAVNPTPDTILNTQESALDKLWEVNVKAPVLLLQESSILMYIIIFGIFPSVLPRFDKIAKMPL
ncbi:Tropinone reductase-like 3 [Bienertia sinuspersici]